MHTYPWTDVIANAGSRPGFGFTLATTDKDARTCHATDLSVHPQLGAGLGTAYLAVLVRNEGATCRLPNVARIALIDDRGVVWNSTGDQRDSQTATRPVTLVHGSWAELSGSGLAVGSTCGGYGHTTVLRLTLPGGAGTNRVAYDLGPPGPDQCVDDGPAAGRAPRPHPGQLQGEPFQAIEHSQEDDYLIRSQRLIKLVVPATARRGTTLHYEVYVSPRTNQAPLWDTPCPLFQQTLVGKGPTYQLNCDPLRFLENPYQAGVFDMQLAVPADAPLGRATLAWQLVEPKQEPVSAPVDITD